MQEQDLTHSLPYVQHSNLIQYHRETYNVPTNLYFMEPITLDQ